MRVVQQLAAGQHGGAGLFGHDLSRVGQHLHASAAQLGDVDVFAGAVGAFAVAVAQDVVGGNVVGLHQVRHQLGHRFELCIGGARDIEVADHADADAVLVEFVIGGFGVGT